MEETNYEEVESIKVSDKEYVYLVNPNNPDDFIINKISIKDGNEYYVNLDDENEYNLALMYFMKKHIGKE